MGDCPAAQIPAFFAGRSLFITGGSGFMGKVLIERLLSTCPDINHLYLLMREKKGVSPEKRLMQLKQCEVFDVLRATSPGQLEKLSIISGDMTMPEIGISEDARASLKNVSIVYHVAATVKLQEELKQSVDQNLRSVMSILELLDTLPNIEAFMHVSTAYANAERAVIEERVYPPPMDLQELLTMVSNQDMSVEEGRQITASKPNTYTFTKAMSEHVVEQHGCQRYPIAIFRPSIVVSSLRHPLPGWIENLNGPAGPIAGSSTGVLHVLRVNTACRADMIPVDIAIDTLIACTWETVMDRSSEVRVYNCSSYENPTFWGDFRRVLNESVPLYPSGHALTYPFIISSKNRLIHKLLEISCQTLPLYFIHYLTLVLGVKTTDLLKANQKVQAMNRSIEHFATNEWEFKTDNVVRLRQRLSERDRALYNVDVRSISWNDHFVDFIKGTRKYVLKEPESNIAEARKRVQRFGYIITILKVLLTLLLYRLTVRHVLPLLSLAFSRYC